MIAPLRNTHRRTFALLAVIVPSVLAIGVAARHPTATLVQPAGTAIELRSAAGHAVFTLRDGRMSVRTLTPVPDPLLYWTSARPTADSLSSAAFIGSADPNATYTLPREAGYLVLYSGAHQHVVDSLRLESRP